MIKTFAAVYRAKNKEIFIEEIKLSPPNKNEIIVENKYSGLCGSILTNLKRDPREPELLGHEGTGIVIQKGKEVKNINIGDKVLISWMPAISSSKTKYLQYSNFYLDKKKYRSVIYTLSKHSKLNSQFVSKLPNDLNLMHSSIIGCAGISGYSAILNCEGLNKKKKICIFGAGGLGILATNAAKTIGIENLTVVDTNYEKLKFSKKFGAVNLLNPKSKNFEKKILKITQGEGFDFIFDFVGNKNIQETSLDYLKKCIPGYSRGGTLAIVGLNYETINFSPRKLLLNEQSIIGLRGGSVIMKRDLRRIYTDIRNKKLHIKKYVSKNFKLSNINKALVELKKGKILGRASVEIDV